VTVETTMSAEPTSHVQLSGPTYHALQIVARIDKIAVEEIVEALVATYLERRLRTVHKAATHSGSVVDLSAWREESGAASARRRRTTKVTRRRSAFRG
jgi:hypothetical protein